MMRSLAHLLDKLVFAGLVVLGMQIPGFVIQYQHTLEAHYREARQHLQQYQTVADHYFAGDLNQLLGAHRHNNVEAIRAEAKILENLIQRHAYLRQQLDALVNQPLYRQLHYLFTHRDWAITEEVYLKYRPTVPLSSEALIAGISLAAALNVLLYLFILTVSRLFRFLLRHSPLKRA